MGFPAWEAVPLEGVHTVDERRAEGARLGPAGRRAAARQPFSIGSLALAEHAWPPTLRLVEFESALLEVGTDAAAVAAWAAGPADVGAALARTTLVGLTTLVLTNCSTSDGSIAALFGRGGEVLAGAYAAAGRAGGVWVGGDELVFEERAPPECRVG